MTFPIGHAIPLHASINHRVGGSACMSNCRRGVLKHIPYSIQPILDEQRSGLGPRENVSGHPRYSSAFIQQNARMKHLAPDPHLLPKFPPRLRMAISRQQNVRVSQDHTSPQGHCPTPPPCIRGCIKADLSAGGHFSMCL